MNKTFLRPALITICVLLIPLIGTEVSLGWHWEPSDFLFMGTLIFGTCFAYEILARNAKSPTQKTIIGVVLTALLILVWIQLAVGIF